MESALRLIHIWALITGTSAAVYDVFAARGEVTVMPLNVKLQYTSGVLCNKIVWTLERPGHYLVQVASVNDLCVKQGCNNEDRPHCSLTTNGSLELQDVRPSDAGQYTVSTYHISRVKNTEDKFNLHVQDAVSEPVISLRCPSGDQPVVSCHTDHGTDVSTSIIVNGELLGDTSGSEGNRNVFKMSSSAPWNISCFVKNKVSQKTTNVLYNMCPVPLSEPRLKELCHPDGSVEISCEVENGTEPSFSWVVDGNPVTSTSDWKVEGNRLSGPGSVATNVSCSAWNQLSSVQSSVITVSCPAVERRLRDYKEELLQLVSCELQTATLAEHFRGLRLNLPPALVVDDPIYRQQLDLILNKCSLEIIVLTIETLQRKLVESLEKIAKIEQQISTASLKEDWSQHKSWVDKVLQDFRNSNQFKKHTKFLQDTEDYNNNREYRSYHPYYYYYTKLESQKSYGNKRKRFLSKRCPPLRQQKQTTAHGDASGGARGEGQVPER